jgi:UDP-3-O-[3-hydroxymyristoyl] glucosamine N-acyltransferase
LAISLGSLASQFGCELIGDPGSEVSRVGTLANAGPGAISFLANPAYRSQLEATAATAVVIPPEAAEACPVDALLAADPYLTFARIATALHPRPQHAPGIHASAIVDPAAIVHETAHIAPLAVIQAGSTVGPGVYVGPGSVVGTNCSIGEASHLSANVTLVDDVSIGSRAIVHAGVVIGADGFGHKWAETGWLKVPQVGGVRIGDDVEIGACTSIDRGSIDDTVIGSGVRLDNQIQIAHNCSIGEHTVIASGVGVSGSVTIGKRCIVGGKAGFVGHISVCDDAVITGAAVVTKDITQPGVYSSAFSAEKDSVWKRRVARFRRLDSLAKRVAALENKKA